MQYVTIASTGNMVDAGDLTAASAVGNTFGSPTRGFYSGLASPTNTKIDFFNFASTGNAQNFGDMPSAEGSGSGLSSATRGIQVGGG